MITCFAHKAYRTHRIASSHRTAASREPHRAPWPDRSHSLHLLSYIFYLVTALSLFTSCGLIEVAPDSEAQVPTDMHFSPDTVYVMVGDTFVVQPQFSPDTIKNKIMFWDSMNSDIVSLKNDTLIAEQEGWTRIIATSVSMAKADSLDVCVMEPWVMPNNAYAYEMVVYADVTVHGQPMTNDMILAAFCADILRGVATPIRVGKKDLWRLRIYHDYELPLDYAGIQFSLWLYDRKTLQRHQFPVYVPYTGETYSTPSNPLKLTIE